MTRAGLRSCSRGAYGIGEVQQLEQLESEGLDSGGRGDDHRVLSDGEARRAQQRIARLGAAVEGEGEDGLAKRGDGKVAPPAAHEGRANTRADESKLDELGWSRSCGVQHAEREGEQRARHDLHDELAAVC